MPNKPVSRKRVSSTSLLLDLVNEADSRGREMLRMYRPLPNQLPIFTTKAPELVVRGGNRTGKTTSVSCLFASLAMGVPIYVDDNTPIPSPWPADWTKGNLLLWVVGYDEKHLGQTIYRHLFKPGLFRTIRDIHTKKWRIFRPWDEQDIARSSEAADSEPLIPERYVKSWSWKDKAAGVFDSVELVNGTTICAFSSRSEAKQGDKVHCIWIDEDIEYSSHVAEWRMRLVDYKGRLIWSVFPHVKNSALVDMCDQASEQKHWDKPIVEEIKLSTRDNPFISSESIQRVMSTLSLAEQKSRLDGDFNEESFLVYPQFSKRVHCGPSESSEAWDEIDLVMSKKDRPQDWTRYLSLDPGYQTCAVIFGAVPPPSLFEDLPDKERYLVIERELYLHSKTIDQIAQEISLLTKGFIYHSFVIDWHAARQTPMSGGKTIFEQYKEAFAKYRIESTQTGHSFLRGNDNIDSRISIVREYLTLNRHLRPRLRISKDHCPNTIHEFGRYRFRFGKNGQTNEAPVKMDDHAMDAIGYLVSLRPEFVHANYESVSGSPAYNMYKTLISKQRATMGSGRFINLGPTV